MTAARIVWAVVCAVFLSACDETLPPRNEPVNPLAPSCEVQYYQTRTEEWVYITVRITNTYTEVFSDVTNIFGYINFAWEAHPELQLRVALSGADLKSSYFNPLTGQSIASRASYNPANKMLTIPVGASAVFQYRWDSKFDSLTDIRDMLGFTKDPTNPGILRSPEVRLTVNGGIRLYKKLPMIYLQPTVSTYRYKRTVP